MTATHRIRLYAVVLTALVVLLAIGAILDPRRGRSPRPLFPGLEETSVQQVEISSVAGTMIRRVQSWVIDEGGREYPARSDRIESLLSEIVASRVVRRVTGNESLWPDFGVTEEAGTRLMLKSGTSGGTEQVRTVVWGGYAAEPGLSYLRLGQSSDVYASDGELHFYLQQPLSYWSYLRVLPEDMGFSDVVALSSSVELQLSDGERLSSSYVLEREGAGDLWVSRNPAGAAGPLDGETVKRLLREVVDLVGTDFSRDEGFSALPVVGTIEIALSDGRDYSVEILESADGFVCRAAGPALPGDPFGGLAYELTDAKVRRLFPVLSELTLE
ncbi:MAG: DUF4340 domain-containing protein [Spirochaetia bacterium]